jgi:hypothetical protein
MHISSYRGLCIYPDFGLRCTTRKSRPWYGDIDKSANFLSPSPRINIPARPDITADDVPSFGQPSVMYRVFRSARLASRIQPLRLSSKPLSRRSLATVITPRSKASNHESVSSHPLTSVYIGTHRTRPDHNSIKWSPCCFRGSPRCFLWGGRLCRRRIQI